MRKGRVFQMVESRLLQSYENRNVRIRVTNKKLICPMKAKYKTKHKVSTVRRSLLFQSSLSAAPIGLLRCRSESGVVTLLCVARVDSCRTVFSSRGLLVKRLQASWVGSGCGQMAYYASTRRSSTASGKLMLLEAVGGLEDAAADD